MRVNSGYEWHLCYSRLWPRLGSQLVDQTTYPKKIICKLLGTKRMTNQVLCKDLRPVAICFGLDIVVNIKENKAVRYVDPLFLFGSNVLYAGAGRQGASFNYLRALAARHKEIEFIVDEDTKSEALDWVPHWKGYTKPAD